MRAEEKDRGIVVKRMLRAIAVMDIPVHDGDTLQPVPLLKIPRRHGDIIEETKPHGMSGFRMVPRRTARAKGVVEPAFIVRNGRRLDTAARPARVRQRAGKA